MLSRLKSTAKNMQRELKVYRLVLKDKRTPLIAKIFLGLAVAYLLSPIDIIPDFIPILGQLDDLIIVPLLVVIALKLIPKHIIEDYRNEINSKCEYKYVHKM